jgi:hypothetical protein
MPETTRKADIITINPYGPVIQLPVPGPIPPPTPTPSGT